MPLGLTWIVDHRIWRAQIKLVMPLVDQVPIIGSESYLLWLWWQVMAC